MALDAATLAWISRLGPATSSQEIVQLQMLRRHATTASETRLIESILSPGLEAEARRTERASIEQRIAQLEAMQSADHVRNDDVARRVAEKRLRLALTDPGPQQVTQAEAERRARTATKNLGTSEAVVTDELAQLRTRLTLSVDGSSRLA